MSELKVISNTPSPRTRQSLATDLLHAGLTPEMNVIVHSSLSSLGWVCGGSAAVVQALMDAITPAGTLIMPTHSGDLSDPNTWQAPAVPTNWWSTIYETMPAFDSKVTPTRGMGKIVEAFRTWQGVVRSSHPAVSFAAWGKHAEEIIFDHALDNSLGENSPLATLYELNACVLLLGVGYDRCTSFHLAEYRVDGTQQVSKGAPVLEAGQRVWKYYSDIEFDNDCFFDIGRDLENTGHVKVSKVGSAQTKLLSVRNAVDFAVDWLTTHPR